MNSNGNSAWAWMAWAVVAHLVVSVVHGATHAQAHVPLSPAASAFVFTVILIGPLVGLAVTWPSIRVGSWIVAISMAGALVFGIVNHFVLDSPDHVSHVDPRWRSLFIITAVLLVVTEVIGAGLALRAARERR